jgi:O-antigen ligase
VAQVFNPGSTSVFYGFLGLKLYFLYVPLMYLGYALIDSELDLRRFFMFNAALLLVVGGLGIAQAIIGPSFLNPETLQEDIRGLSTLYRISPITGLSAYRPNSIFVSTGRFQNLIIASWMIIVGFGGYLLLRSKKGRWLAFSAIGALAGAAVMSTSRGVVMWCGGSTLVILAAFLWGAPWRRKEVTRVIRSIQRVVLLGGLVIVVLAVIFPEQMASRFAIYSETLSPYSTASELAFRTRDYPLKNFLDALSTPHWPYGYGTGTASLGIQYVARILKAPGTGVSVENGYGQLVVEMGIVGLLLWISLGLSICLSAWKLVKQLRGSPWFPMAFAFFWFAFMMFFPIGYNTLTFYQDFLVNAYLWILVGMLYKLPRLALSAQFAVESSALRAESPAAFRPKDSWVPSA